MTDDSQLDSLDLAPETTPVEPESKGFWKKLKKGLLMTHTEFLERLEAAVIGRGVVDDQTLEHLEETLISTDLGVETSLELIERLKDVIRSNEAGNVQQLRQRLVDEMAVLLSDADRPGCRCEGFQPLRPTQRVQGPGPPLPDQFQPGL